MIYALAILKPDWSPYMIDIYDSLEGRDFQMEIFSAIDSVIENRNTIIRNGSTRSYLGQLSNDDKICVWGMYLSNMMTIITVTNMLTTNEPFLNEAKDIFNSLCINPLFVRDDKRLIEAVKTEMRRLVERKNK